MKSDDDGGGKEGNYYYLCGFILEQWSVVLKIHIKFLTMSCRRIRSLNRIGRVKR